MRTRRGSGNVFRDLGFPEGEAHVLALCSALMIRIEKVVARSGRRRAEMARRLGFAQPSLNALLRGKLNQFNLEALLTIAARAGLRAELRIVRQRDVGPRPASKHGAPGSLAK